jgi:hypothetical protein
MQKTPIQDLMEVHANQKEQVNMSKIINRDLPLTKCMKEDWSKYTIFTKTPAFPN